MTDYKTQARKDLKARIAAKRDEATRLENQRGLSAQAATNNVSRAKELRSEADWLEHNYQTHEVQSWLVERENTLRLKEDHVATAARDAFSTMQNEVFSVEDARKERSNQAMNAVVYNAAIGVHKDTLARQLGKLIDGQGSVDGKGNKFVRFSEGDGGVYRAILTPDGHFGFISEGRGEAGDGAGSA